MVLLTKKPTGRAFDTKDYDNGGDNKIINGSKVLNFKSTRRTRIPLGRFDERRRR